MIIPENTSRKVDQLGRITLPKGLRDRLSLVENDELELFTGEIDGRSYILLSRPVDEESRLRAAAKLLFDAGYTLSGEVGNLIGEDA